MVTREEKKRRPYPTVGNAVTDLSDLKDRPSPLAQLFEMTGQRCLYGFSSLPLSSGDLPDPFEQSILNPAAEQDLAVLLNEGQRPFDVLYFAASRRSDLRREDARTSSDAG